MSDMLDDSKEFYNAVRFGDSDKASALLKVPGVNINYQGASGRTALHLAVQKGDYQFIRYLLKKGADVHIRDMRGLAPEDYADDPEVHDMFVRYGPAVLPGLQTPSLTAGRAF
mmetsp:Transcript_42480/g.73910  ORF Transcript_42480/g.73910 Transcript_42480/m.73910 type:complete len:113 (-) Transcript_42480:377-715(-)|eukprot:CAMPEP_0184966590 /NCGR_PEP_ID=MMETSP1098-20130426/217_1 /TAXON_ID=89044 /ORGANISM="Spumella elongata, Strain CCAP 955/1" /LENGTH=112 /DNA_ID=CAMNT_0027487887 /DNA_START=69 /DNA_END=407 /DNA_ORIENTATION=+